MTPDQQRKMLEAAAKACGAHAIIGATDDGVFTQWSPILRGARLWNPLTNPADTAEMCATLGVNTTYWWGSNEVECQCFFVKEFTEFFAYRTAEKDHDNSRLKAWMYAATMVAAKTQGYEE